MIARLLLDTRVMVGEMDAAVEEVSSMISGLTPQKGIGQRMGYRFGRS